MDIDINKFSEILNYFDKKKYLFINADLKLAKHERSLVDAGLA